MWELVELVKWGVKRCAEADRQDAPFIVVAQLYSGSARISSRVEQYGCVVRVLREAADRGRAGFAVLERGQHGWFVSDSANCEGDRTDVNSRLREICAQAD
jgi:hypothetical protein